MKTCITLGHRKFEKADLEKCVRYLAEEYDLAVEFYASVPFQSVQRTKNKRAEYACALTENRFHVDVEIEGRGRSMFDALRGACAQMEARP